jgi:hypothetical protein
MKLDDFFATNLNSISQSIPFTSNKIYYDGIILDLNVVHFTDILSIFSGVNHDSKAQASLWIIIPSEKFELIADLKEQSHKFLWEFHTHLIFTDQDLVYGICMIFTKGDFPMDFRTGKIKPAVKRSGFGGSLKSSHRTRNDRKVSYGMFEEIIKLDRSLVSMEDRILAIVKVILKEKNQILYMHNIE